MTPTLLIELLTEELPPNSLKKLGESFANTIFNELVSAKFVNQDSKAITYASPRRLAVQIPNVLGVQPDQEILRKGPSLAVAMKDGEATQALLGFARSCKTSVAQLIIVHDGKQDVYAYGEHVSGMALSAVLTDIVGKALKNLPVSKLMRWGDSTYHFVRPVHGLIMLHGEELISGEVLGLQSRHSTLGHRFLSEGLINIPDADSYQNILEEQGKVIASFDARQNKIREHLKIAAQRIGGTIVADEALYEEVTALVECPVILEASFDPEFLSVPPECLILTMQKNQKYFPLLDAQGKLSNRFLLVSNIDPEDTSHIINGNQRVLRARLSDAKFFFEQDKKQTLENRVAALKNVVYHNKLGSQLERVERVVNIATSIYPDTMGHVRRAAYLCKADLLSEMVGEFPELQGIIGRYYALHDGENKAVADAIAEHYLPRFSGDNLPTSEVSVALALADKLETLVGIWGIGLIPTGDKDPFALRRAALGVVRILLNSKITVGLKKILSQVYDFIFTNEADKDQLIDDIFAFCMDRLKNYLLVNSNYAAGVIDAVICAISEKDRLDIFYKKLDAVSAFQKMPESKALASANKRVNNFLCKISKNDKKTFSDEWSQVIDASLFEKEEEIALYECIGDYWRGNKNNSFANYTELLFALAKFKEPIDNFFDKVMVAVPDDRVRMNRIRLLYEFRQCLNVVADISKLAN